MVGFRNPGGEAGYWQKTGGACLSEVNVCPGAVVRAKITPKTIPFFDAYSKKYGFPHGISSINYDGLCAIAEAAKRAKSFETTDLIKALEELDYQGVGGRVVFDKKTHDAKYSPDYLPVQITQWQKGGEWVIIAPEKFATGKFTNPPWLK
jgi:branched-chain amino acid transport system substrate-binding protein